MLGIHNDLVHHDHIDLYTGVVDLPEGSTAAYGLRRLSSTYFGYACNIVNPTTLESLDVKFLPSGVIDSVAVEEFCNGTDDAYIKTWYDQTGQGNHLVQSDQSLRPQLVDSGTVITNPDNGKFSAKFQGDSMETASALSLLNGTITIASSVICVAKADSGLSSDNRLYTVALPSSSLEHNASFLTPSGASAGWKVDNSVMGNPPTNYISSDLTDTYIHMTSHVVVAVKAGFNDGPISTISGSALMGAAPDSLFLGSTSDSSNPDRFNGLIQEFIMYNSANILDVDLLNISAQINSFYGVY
jgi:hypothetical protein